MPAHLTKVYGSRPVTVESRSGIGGWGFDEIFLPGTYCVSPKQKKADSVPSTPRSFKKSPRALLNATARSIPEMGALSRSRDVVRAELMTRQLESVVKPGPQADVLWEDEELRAIRERTVEMRNRTLQLLHRAEDADREFREGFLPDQDGSQEAAKADEQHPLVPSNPSDSRPRTAGSGDGGASQSSQRPSQTEGKPRRSSWFEAAQAAVAAEHARTGPEAKQALEKAVEAFRWAAAEKIGSHDLHENDEERTKVLMTLEREESLMQKMILTGPRKSCGLREAPIMEEEPGEPGWLKKPGPGEEGAASHGAPDSHPGLGPSFRAQAVAAGAATRMRTGSIVSNSGRRVGRLGPTVQRRANVASKAGSLSARLAAAPAPAKPKVLEPMDKVLFENRLGIPCGGQHKPALAHIRVLERLDGQGLRVKAHMLSSNRLLEMAIQTNHIDHILKYCEAFAESRKKHSNMPTSTIPEDEEDLERRYDILTDVLAAELDQNGRPSVLKVPGYVPPAALVEDENANALGMFADIFRNKATETETRFVTESPEQEHEF